MTTVDSWPKTLPMLSAWSWNSTTETHLRYTRLFLPIHSLGTKKSTLHNLPICAYHVSFFIYGAKERYYTTWAVQYDKKLSNVSNFKVFFDHIFLHKDTKLFFLIDFQAMYMIIQGIFMVYPCLRFFQDHWPQLDELISVIHYLK